MTQAWRHRRRIELGPTEVGVPDVVLFGRYNYAHAEPGLDVHAHEQSMEFCFLLRGRQTYRVGNRSYQLTGGDVFVTYPDEPHGTGDAPEEKGVLYWVIVKIPPAGRSFLGLAGAQAAVLRQSLIDLTERRFRGPRRLSLYLDAITQAHFADRSPLRSVRFQNRLVTLLLEVIKAARQRDPHALKARAITDRLVQMIESSLTEPVSIAQLAATAGLSVQRFKVWFKEQTGVPPGEYILRRRVEEARRRLTESNASITDLGYELGFSSSQYFATVVKRFTGQTPQQVRLLGRMRK